MNTTIAATHLASTTGSNEPKSDHDHPHPDATTTAHHRRQRALVLGGGGSTGNAWLIGVIAGLADAGLDVTGADLTIGTSAGSTAAAQIGWGDPAELYAATLVAPTAAQLARGASGRPNSSRPVVNNLERLIAAIAPSADAVDYRRRLSAAALEQDAASAGSWSERWRATVAARLPEQGWP